MGRGFLFLLASAEAEYLDYIKAKLLPHRLSIDLNAREPNYNALHRHPYHADSALDVQSCRTHSTVYPSTDWRDHLSRALQGPTPDNVATLSPTVERRWPNLGHNQPSETSTVTSTNKSELATKWNVSTGGIVNVSAPWPQVRSAASPSQMSSDWNGSPIHERVFTWSEDTPTTHWTHTHNQLVSIYGEPFDNIVSIVKLGDSAFRDDAASFIKDLCSKWDQEGVWSRLPLSNPATGGSLVERMLQSLQCAEIIECDATVDPVRLKMARILLHHYYEQTHIALEQDPSLSSRLCQGKRPAGVATDIILERMYGTTEISKRRRNSLEWHKRIGKRWSYVASYLGVGIVLTCSRSLETHV